MAVVAQQAAANLERALIEAAADLEGHGLLLPRERALTRRDPVNLLLGDDPRGERLQVNLPEVHDRWRQGSDRMDNAERRNPG